LSIRDAGIRGSRASAIRTGNEGGALCNTVNVVRWYFRIPLGTRLVVAFAAGAGVGLLMGPGATVLAPASRLLIDILRLLAPIVVATFVLSALSGGSLRGIGVTAAKTLAGCLIFAAVAAAIGALTVAAIRPLGVIAMPDAAMVKQAAWWDTLTAWLPGRGAGIEKAVPLAFALTVPVALALGAWKTARPDGPARRCTRGHGGSRTS
jgi:Na+/H+-dicarboxylate symporter